MHRDQIAIGYMYSRARNILDGGIWCHQQRETCLSASKQSHRMHLANEGEVDESVSHWISGKLKSPTIMVSVDGFD